jgi:membrane-bound PQQ-dependent dehydrogenase (glucose/quinate/shikimate family)
MTMRVAALGLAIFSALLWRVTAGETQAVGADWPDFAGSAAGTRYTPLTQITSANVDRLQLAWQYKLDPPHETVKHPYVAFEATPLKVGDSVYFCTPNNELVALDAESGQPRWKFIPTARKWGGFRACRGVAFFHAQITAGECQDRIVSATIDAHLYEVDAKTGKSCPGFGEGGSVDLLAGMGAVAPGVYSVTSAPTIVRGVVVVGGMVMDNGQVNNPSGVIRAYDVATGKLAWAWDMGRPNVHTAPAEGESYTRNTPNGWAPFSSDESLGLVFVPTGNSNPDYYGAQRTPEADKYSSSVVALDATSGDVRWSFQTAHHDLWDYDVASQPVLVDMPGENGGSTPALIQATKRGEIFVLDRRDGHPLTEVVEKPVPQGGAPGDHTSATQPFSVGMPSLAGPDLAEHDMWGITPLDELWCRIKFRQARYDGPMTPPTPDRPWIYTPGWMGGNDWGSVSVDESRHVLVAVSMRMANYDRFVMSDELAKGADGAMHSLITPQVGSPFFGVMTDYFHSPLGVPCQRPPFGMISAIDLRTHRLLWSRPLGTARDNGPLALPAIRIPWPIPMGTVTMGGNLVTASGLVFVAGTLDQYLRALDESTGKELWRTDLSAAGFSTPMSYISPHGRQLVVVAVGGNSKFGPNQGLYVQAYALP